MFRKYGFSMNLTKKNKMILLMISIIVIILLVLLPMVGNTHGAVDKTYTREKMQDMIVSTTLNYYYNGYYSDYGQYPMDNKNIGDNNYFYWGTLYWRDLNASPESVGRSNYFHVDCSAFAFLTYYNTFGYDMSKYKDINTYFLFDKDDEYPLKRVNTYEDIDKAYKKAYQKFGQAWNNSYMVKVANKISDNCSTSTCSSGTKTGVVYDNLDNSENTELAYYYVADGHETPEKLKEEYKKAKEELQPGDIILYSRNRDGNISGHVMIYIGGDTAFTYETNLIHSTGYDYNNESTSVNNKLYKSQSILRSNGETYIENTIDNLEEQGAYLTKFIIFRPINTMCKSDLDCDIKYNTNNVTLSEDKLNNSFARLELKKLRTEQWMSENKEYEENKSTSNIKSKYNSINVGDDITYNLRLTNKYDNTKTENLTITAKIPDNATFVSCNNNCIVNGKNVSWENVSINGEDTYKTYNYTVKAEKEGKLINEGMKIKTEQGNVLSMSSLSISVNPTINGINKEILLEEVNKFKELTENGKIKYSTEGYRSENIKDLDTLDSASISQMGFVKMVYYNAFGMDLDMLENKVDTVNITSIKNAIFDNVDYPELNNNATKVNGEYPKYNGDKSINIFAKKTNISNLTGVESNINKMLVEGLYGGGHLKGNDNNDRIKFLRSFKVNDGLQSDLEFGDIIFIFSQNAEVLNTYLYLGEDSYGPVLALFKTNGELVLYNDKYLDEYYNDSTLQANSNNKPANQILNEMFSKDLFVVLRPSKIATTVNYNYNGGRGSDDSYVAYNTYKNLETPTKESYKVTLEYNEEVSSIYPKTLSSKNTFNGWYTENNIRVTNNTPLATEETHTLNAKYITSSVTLPNPKKEGYYFDGWYKDSALNNRITNEVYTPSKNETLYAKFIELPEVEINLKLEEKNKINLEVEKQKGNLSGYEIYLYNNETNTYEKIRDENDLETTIDYEFKDFENVKIYVRPFITIENKRVYGNISSIKEIGPEIKVGTLEITKIDKETKEKLEGTEIEIYDEQTNERVFKGTTNKNGILKVNDLIIGKNYYLKETVPSKGYKLNNEEIKIKLEKENEEKKIQIENEIIKGNIKITVVEEYTKEPIENVSVLINDESKSTNVLGEIILDDVRYGNYVISLEEVPDGYLLNDKKENIMIEEETTEEITITLEKEKIPVPITDSDKNNLLEKIIGILLIVIGIVSIVLYVKKKNA